MRLLNSVVLSWALLVLLVPLAGAQVVTVEPAFPNEEEPVTLIFNAREGSGGLAGYTGDVYTQTGVVTSEGPWERYEKTNWDQNTADTKLERIGEDLYRLYIPDIRAYYNRNYRGDGPIPDDASILRLAFVLRSADGKRQGNDVGAAVSARIFVDLFPRGVHVRFANPVVGPVEQPRVRIDSSLSVVAIGAAVGVPLAEMRLLVDGEETVRTTADTLAYTLPYQPGSVRDVRVIAEDINGEVGSQSFEAAFVSRAVPDATRPSWLPATRFESIVLDGQGGAPGARVEAILQDRKGFMWFGTNNGLYRYDGHSFTVFQHDPDESNSLSHNLIYALIEDAAGLLWIGTQAGLNRFDPSSNTVTQFLHDADDANSLSNDWVTSVFEDRYGVLWVGTHAGLDRLDRSTDAFSHYAFDEQDPKGLSFGRVKAIHEDSSGTLWLGTWGGGLNQFDRATETFKRYLPASSNLHTLSSRFVQSIFEDHDGFLWIGTAAGLDRFDRLRGTFERFRFETDNAVGLRTVYSVHQDEDGMLWIGAFGGLHRLDPDTGDRTKYWHDPSDPNSVRHSDVFKIYEDRSGVRWIGSGNGLDKMKRVPFRSFWDTSVDKSNAGNLAVHAVYEDHSGVVWLGKTGGLARFDRVTQTNTFFPYHTQSGVTGFEDLVLNAVIEDRQGLLWVGTHEGVSRFDRGDETFIWYPYDPVVALDREASNIEIKGVVYTIYEAPSQPGILWIGDRTGLLRFDPKGKREFVHYPLETAHPQGWHQVNAIYEAPSQPGVLWVGTAGGFNKVDIATGRNVHYYHDPDNPNSLSGDEVYTVYEDSSGALWVGTRDGLNRFDRATGTFTRFTTHNGLPDNFAKGILGDDKGHLWISTGNGLSRLNPTTLSFRNYDTRDGLQDNLFLEGAYHRNKRGELFFGGQKGFTLFRPEDIDDNPRAPAVVLTDFAVFGRSVRLDQPLAFTERLQLFSNQNTFSFEFAALDYTAPDQNQYAYRLEGFDNEWVDSGTNRFARYTNVSPGKYVFRVRASNSDGVWNEKGASVGLVITPPFWKTEWFFALCLLFVLSLASAAGNIVRARRLEAHALELNKLVEDRTRELVIEQKITEAQARRLADLDQTKSRFFANISHEFRTPLTLILGPLCDMLDGAHGPISVAARRQLELMHRSSRRLHSLISQLLDLSTLDVGRLAFEAQRQDLIPFLKGIVLSFSALAERQHVTLQFNAEVVTLPLAFDADKLEKVVVNLLSNAFKFTPEGGKIRVCACEAVDGQHAYAEIQVKDTGRGIPAKALPHVFDRFYQVNATTTREQEGTGIGLALAKELVTLHGGTIRVESEEGFGSSFTVRLPITQDPAEFPDEVGESKGDRDGKDRKGVATGNGYSEAYRLDGDWIEPDWDLGEPVEAPQEAPTILIVDDNDDVREYLNACLRGFYHVIEANDGLDAIDKTRAKTPDLVISDVMMPNMDGVALCRAIKEDERLNHIPVILLTAKADEEAEVEGLNAGADDYVVKPFQAKTLLARAENLIEIRRLLRQRFSGEVVVLPSNVVAPSDEAAFLDRVRETIEAHLGDHDFTVEWLADEVGLSPRQLQRRLRALTALSPAGLIRMMRLERAAQLLDQHAGTISEIAYQVGFKDPHYFSRLFQQTFGSAPSEHLTHRT